MKKAKIILLIISFIFVLLFNNNYFMYKTSILKVTNVTNKIIKNDDVIIQDIEGIIKNGKYKNQKFSFKYESSKSLVDNEKIKKNSKIFVKINNSNNVSFIEIKRDSNIVFLIIILIDLIVIIAGKHGLRSLLGTMINIAIMISIIFFYTENTKYNLLLIFIPLTLVLISVPLMMSNGYSEKSKSAIYGSIISIFFSFLLSYFLLKNHEKSINYYTMEFIDVVQDYKNVYLVIVLLSGLGAIMDISITMSSSISELIDKNPKINYDKLKKSASNISSDIVGTMINVLLLTSIISILPTIIFLYKNNMDIINAINVYGQTQIIIILTSSIGIILSIPICKYVSLYIFGRRLK